MEPRIPVSKCVIKNVIKNWVRFEHDKVWQARKDCRQSRTVLPNTDHKWKHYILRRDKDDIRLLTQLVTGHANLKYHRFLMGLEDDEKCELCGQKQTAIHVLTECPGLVGERLAILGKPTINEDDIRKFSIDRILKFARNTEYWNY